MTAALLALAVLLVISGGPGPAGSAVSQRTPPPIDHKPTNPGPSVRADFLKQANKQGGFANPRGGPAAASPKDNRTPKGPSPEQMNQLSATERQNDAKAQSDRATPEAQARRRRSRDTFRKSSRADAIETARSEFPSELAAPTPNPLDLPTGEQVDDYPGPFSALIEDTQGDDKGHTHLLQSTVPLRSTLGDGTEAPVDLGLQSAGDDLEPKNPVVPTKISKDIASGVSVGNDISIKTSDQSDPVDVEDGHAYFANSETDTDTVITPSDYGLELAWQLRSPDSPESLGMAFNLPTGGSLRANDKSGGVDILDGDGKAVGAVAAPHAEDAAGTPVPASYDVEGDTVRLNVKHQDADLQYPILVDPAVQQFDLNSDASLKGSNCGDAWTGWLSYSPWGSGSAPAFVDGKYSCYLQIAAVGGRGAQSQYGEWYYPLQGTGYVSRADFYVSHTPRDSCLAEGVYSFNAGGWHYGYWVDPPGYLPPPSTHETSPWNTQVYTGYWNDPQYRGSPCFELHDNEKSHFFDSPGAGADAPVLQLIDQGTPPAGGYGVGQINGAQLAIDDKEAPTVNITANSSPTDWVENASGTVTANASDAGLGVASMLMMDPSLHQVGSNSTAFTCDRAAGLWCPSSSGSKSYSYSTSSLGLAEGTNQFGIWSGDPLFKLGADTWDVKIDRSAPRVTGLSGSLANASNGFAPSGHQTLTVNATDRLKNSDGTDNTSISTSGVKSVHYSLQKLSGGTWTEVGNGEQDDNASCNGNGCPETFNPTFDIDTAGLGDGQYRVDLGVKDQLGDGPVKTGDPAVTVANHKTGTPSTSDHTRLEFEVDHTKPTATNSGDTPWTDTGTGVSTTLTGHDSSPSGVTPSGIKTFGADLPGGGHYGPTSSSCSGTGSSRCPAADSKSVPDETTSAPEGSGVVSGSVTDAAGNPSDPSKWKIRVDHSPPDVHLSGSLEASKDLFLALPSYELDWNATDGARTSDPKDERSGVKQVVVSMKEDGDGHDWVTKYDSGAQTCTNPQSSCSMTGNWTLQTKDYHQGRYVVRVDVTDELGHLTRQEFPVYVLLDQNDIGSALPLLGQRLGLEDYWDYDSTDTGAGTAAHVNSDNGNLVWHSIPIVNPGRGLSIVGNLDYNSQESTADALRPENKIGDALGQYDQVGRGFSLGLSGLTRVNEPLDLTDLIDQKISFTDPDGTRHVFTSTDGCRTFKAEAGLNIYLRRYSSAGLIEPGCTTNTLPRATFTDPDQVWAATRPDGVTHFFDAQGFETSIADRNHNVLSFKYEDRGPIAGPCNAVDGTGFVPNLPVCPRRLVSVVDPGGQPASSGGQPSRQLTLSYYPDEPLEGSDTASGPIKDITDIGGRVTHFDYDSQDYLTKVTEAQGKPAERSFGFGYEAPTTTTPVGLQRRALTKVTDPLGQDTTFAYKSDAPAVYGGLADGLLYEKRVQSVTDRNSKARTYAYADDGTGHKLTVTDPAGQTSTHVVDSEGRPTVLTDENGTRTKLVWDHDQADGNNTVTQLTDAEGTDDAAVTDMEYNANGLLTDQKTYPASGDERHRTLHYAPGSGVYHSQVVDDTGGQFVSDLDSMTNPKDDGQTPTWQFGLDSAGNVTSRTDSKGNGASTAYDAHGEITSETDEQDNTTHYSDFDPTGQPQREIGPREGQCTLYRYDTVGNLKSVIDPRGNPAGDACTVPTDAPGESTPYATLFTYDDLDRLTNKNSPKESGGSSGDRLGEQTTYDGNDNITDSTDARQKNTHIVYTAMDKPSEVDAPGFAGPETTKYGYNDLDQLTSRVDPRGAGFETDYKLDPAGRLLAETRHNSTATGDEPEDLITSYAYDRRDNVVGMVDPKRNVGRTVDEAIQAAASSPRVESHYDKDDELTDEIDHPTSSDLQDGVKPSETKYGYDKDGDRTTVQAPRAFGSDPYSSDFTTHYSYDQRDQLIDVENPEHKHTHYSREKDGKVVGMTTPRGVAKGTMESDEVAPGVKPYLYYTTRYTYDANGDLKSRSIPFAPQQYGLGNDTLARWKVSYDRDGAGNPKKITDARGNSFTNTFFANGALHTTERPSWWQLDWKGGGQNSDSDAPGSGAQGDDASSDGESQYSAPDAGQHYQADDDDADTDFAQGGPQLTEADSSAKSGGDATPDLPDSSADNFGAVNRQQLPDMVPARGHTTFDYDDDMRLTDITDVADKKRSISYDDAGRVQTKTWPFKEGTDITHAYTYDPDGDLTSYDDGRHPTTYSYDGLDRRSSEEMSGASAGPGSPIHTDHTTYHYDPDGNLTGRDTPRGGSFDFTYDSLDRLATETNPASERWSYRHDADGNVTKEISPIGQSDPDAQAHNTTLAYDAADQLIKSTDGLGQDTTIGYDDDGNQNDVKAPGAAESPGGNIAARETTTTYDGRGLPWKTSKGPADSERQTVTEYDPNGNLRRTVNPAGLDGAHNPEINDDGSNSDTNLQAVSKNATVNVYNSDDELERQLLPWGDVGDPSHHTPDNDQRSEQDFHYDSRGRVDNAQSAFRVGDTTAPSRSYTYYDNDWPASTSDEEVLDPDRAHPSDYKQLIDYDYDAQGNQTSWKSRNADSSSRGRTVTRKFFPNGLMATRTARKPTDDAGDGDAKTTRSYAYYYNPNRSLIQMDDCDPARGSQSPAECDATNETDSRVRKTNIGRDNAERESVVNETWAGGRDTHIGYDDDGNVKTRATDGVWNGTDEVDSASGAGDAKTTTFGYDDADRQKSMTTHQGDGDLDRSEHWDLWPSGQVQTKTVDKSGTGNDVVESDYFNHQGEPSEMKRKRGDADLKDQSYSYDDNGNRTTDERGTEAFNARDQLVWWKRGSKQKRPDTEVTYTLNPQGAVAKKTDTALPASGSDLPKCDPTQSITDGPQSVRYCYTGTRLNKVIDKDTTSTYSYDDFGSTTKIQSKLNDDDGSTVLPPINNLPSDLPPACDRQKMLDGSNKDTTLYCFDEFDRMVTARGPGLDRDTSVYTYDGLDRRDSKVQHTSSGDKRRDYSYVGTTRMLSKEKDDSGKSLYYDYDAHGQPEGQAKSDDSSATKPAKYLAYGKDANGSVEELEKTTDTGSVPSDDKYVYDPYGERDSDPAHPPASDDPDDGLSPDAKDNPFRFEGFYLDSGVKTYDMGARDYRPDTGRFLTQDRYQDASSDLTLQADPLTQNRYAFAGGNPVNNIEFDGHLHEQEQNNAELKGDPNRPRAPHQNNGRNVQEPPSCGCADSHGVVHPSASQQHESQGRVNRIVDDLARPVTVVAGDKRFVVQNGDLPRIAARAADRACDSGELCSPSEQTDNEKKVLNALRHGNDLNDLKLISHNGFDVGPFDPAQLGIDLISGGGAGALVNGVRGVATGFLTDAASGSGGRLAGLRAMLSDETGSFRPFGPLSSKIERQMLRRGWTPERIEEAQQFGRAVRAVNKQNGNPATRYIHPSTGQSVVIDDVTNQVIHVGGPGFKYGPNSGDLP